MHDVSFGEALDFIQMVDARYHREAYFFIREALDFTQERMKKNRRGSHHVTGRELLEGIRELALQKFGPMACMVFQEWGINSCQDFGEVVFNMVELGGPHSFARDDFKDLPAFAACLAQPLEPLSRFLAGELSQSTLQSLTRPTADLGENLAADLNRIIAGGLIYEKERFAVVSLSRPAKCLLGRKLAGTHLARLNRLLLEDAYPREIVKSHGVLAKTEEDSRADFADGYDFHEAFQKPFLPKGKQAKQSETTPAPSGM
jgi:uncharacterized repeat protein (TIGR04138 family)